MYEVVTPEVILKLMTSYTQATQALKQLTFKQLQQFVAVVDAGSVQAGAEALHMAQPPLSRSLAKLEAVVGATLLRRTHAGVSLTPQGEAFYDAAVNLLATAGAAVAGVRRANEKQTASMTIGFVTPASNGLLADLVRQLDRPERPAFVRLVEATARTLVGDLVEGKVDVALAYGQQTLPSIRCRTVCADELVLAVPATWVCDEKPFVFERLADEPLICFPQAESPQLYQTIQETLNNLIGAISHGQSAVQTSTILGLVSDGMGYALVPRRGVAVLAPGLRLIELPTHHHPLELCLWWHGASENPLVHELVSVEDLSIS